MSGRHVFAAIRRHETGTDAFPTCACLRGRLEAIGLGRWASLYTGACEPETRRARAGGFRR
jgi:hypothetical protein